MNPPEPVIAQIGRQARLRPEQAAYLCGDEQLTYGELWAGSGRIAAGLRAVMGENPAPVAIHGAQGRLVSHLYARLHACRESLFANRFRLVRRRVSGRSCPAQA